MGKKDEDYLNKLDSRITETFIIQMIFGTAMAIIGLVYLVTSGFNYSLLMTIITGVLLIIYTLYYYIKIGNNLKEIAEKGEKDYESKVSKKLNETFIIQLIFGMAMVLAPLIMMLTSGFDLNLLITLISGGLLVGYSVFYYRVRIRFAD